MSSNVNHPSHYNQYPIEVIDLVENMTFCMGNLIKYILRAPYKGKLKEDCQKAQWYLERQFRLNRDWTTQILYYNKDLFEELKRYFVDQINEKKEKNRYYASTLGFLTLVEDFCENPTSENAYQNLKYCIDVIAEIED